MGEFRHSWVGHFSPPSGPPANPLTITGATYTTLNGRFSITVSRASTLINSTVAPWTVTKDATPSAPLAVVQLSGTTFRLTSTATSPLVASITYAPPAIAITADDDSQPLTAFSGFSATII